MECLILETWALERLVENKKMNKKDKNFKKKFMNFIYNFAFFWSYWYGFWIKATKPKGGLGILPYHENTRSIVQALNYGNDYVLDPLSGAIDIMYHPRKIQERINRGDKIGDCDDHAIYWATCLLKSALASEAWIGTVYYQKEDGSFGGHAICVFRDYSGKLFWSDYGMPNAVDSHEEWSREVGEEKYGKTLIASALVPIISIDSDDTPKFGKSYRLF